MREELIKSAVSFLTDPKVQSAPLAKKVTFLESKGMNAEEIEEAMSRANGKSTGATSSPGTAVLPQQAGGLLVHAPPPIPPRPTYDWRDMFIGAVLAGGIGYGTWVLAKRLFGPWFKVPTQEELEEEKAKLDAQFQSVEDSLTEIKEQTNEALSAVSSQSKRVDESLTSLDTVLKDLKDGDTARDLDFKNVKGDVESLKDLVQKLLDRNKEAQGAVLNDLQNEMKSLKSLLLSRRSTMPGSTLLDQMPNNTSTTSTSAESLTSRLSSTLNAGSRPGIPAWQLAAASTAASEDKAEASSTAKDSTSAASNLPSAVMPAAATVVSIPPAPSNAEHQQ